MQKCIGAVYSACAYDYIDIFLKTVRQLTFKFELPKRSAIILLLSIKARRETCLSLSCYLVMFKF